jgi:glycosyltransferase involved in cell wall biosynthesis
VPFRKIQDWYARCYSVLYTPLHEDLGLVPVEGFAAKKPCIAWNEGGPREVVDDGKDGFLVNSVDEMAAKMKWLAERPEIAEQMGKAGRKKAEKKFSWDVFLKRFGKVCGEVAKARA